MHLAGAGLAVSRTEFFQFRHGRRSRCGDTALALLHDLKQYSHRMADSRGRPTAAIAGRRHGPDAGITVPPAGLSACARHFGRLRRRWITTGIGPHRRYLTGRAGAANSASAPACTGTQTLTFARPPRSAMPAWRRQHYGIASDVPIPLSPPRSTRNCGVRAENAGVPQLRRAGRI